MEKLMITRRVYVENVMKRIGIKKQKDKEFMRMFFELCLEEARDMYNSGGFK